MLRTRMSAWRGISLAAVLALVTTLALSFTALVPQAQAAPGASIAPARGQADTIIYVVRRGDTLGAIARRYNTTIAKLMSLNGIRNADRIYVGQRLRIPTAGGTPAAPVRILFPAGGISATVTGLVAFPNRFCYVAGARAGQEMTVSVTSAGQAANFLVTQLRDGNPLKRLENEARIWTGRLATGGDYLICVATASGTVNYNLSITIPPAAPTPTPLPAPNRIQFAPGATSATRAGSVTGEATQCYVLRAMAGQLMTVQVNSFGSTANFSLVAPDGSPLKRIDVGDPYYGLWLTSTGDYQVCVGVPVGKPATAYTLFVSVVN